mmetsp:Transcript_89878/g.159915  ORF Transcript_89878/g.159915 Transcript_89878/m.159915 type:complete len:447 (+) Transcript_89878:91-1431(+)
MDEIREAQRQKWLRQKEAQAEATNSASSAAPAATGGYEASPAPTAASSSSAAAASTAASVQESSVADTSALSRNCRRAHILPVGTSPVEDHRRLSLLTPTLRALRSNKEPLKTGLLLFADSGEEFVVVKSEPDEALIVAETDFFVEGAAIQRFQKVQFICLWDFEHSRTGKDEAALFNEYISPFFKSIADSGQMANVASVGQTLKILDLEFQVMAAEPSPPEIGIIDSNTMVYVNWDSTPEFEKIHIVPFQDTLPAAYEFDIFNDYLKPYLTRNKLMRFGVNDQFTYQGVQFKVVCCEPNGPARIGKNTTIYCEGVLHPSLRNLLPPELLEQLSSLPPGLQMLLLNTEALSRGYEDRLMEVQEMLSRRQGMQSDAISRIEEQRWGDMQGQGQEQCMVCLSDFDAEDKVRRLPCGHVFHSSCIDEWLRRCTDCPICKTNVDRAVRQY